MPRFGNPGVGAPTRARYLGKQANLQEEREARAAESCRDRGEYGGDGGWESSPPRPAPHKGAGRGGRQAAESLTPSPAAPPAPPPRPGQQIRGILGQPRVGSQRGPLVAAAAPEGEGSGPRRGRRGDGAEAGGRAGGLGWLDAAVIDRDCVRPFLANLGERAGAPRRARHPYTVPLRPPRVGSRPGNGKGAKGKFM